MRERVYKIYKFHYGISSDADLYAEVSGEGLTESESLLKDAIKEKVKSLEGYVLYGIDGTGRKSDVKEVRFDTLNAN